MSGPINLTSRPPLLFFFSFFHVANSEAAGWFLDPGIFLRLATAHLQQCKEDKKKKRGDPQKMFLFHFSAPVSGRIFSISPVDFARLIKSSSLMSCLTSPPSLLWGAYIPAGATSQTDCCPAGMGLAARQGLRGPPSPSFCLNLKCRVGRGWGVGGTKRAEGIEVIPSSSGAAPHTREHPPVNH